LKSASGLRRNDERKRFSTDEGLAIQWRARAWHAPDRHPLDSSGPFVLECPPEAGVPAVVG
jgi:hypothetical protein